MFGMLRAAFTLLICILAVGFYLGWFSFSQSPPDPQSNKVNINVSVDKKKVGSDLQKFEQNVAKRIQDINNQPQSSTPAPLSGQPLLAPGLSLGPISVQPSGQPAGQPQIRLQTQDYQFSVPLGAPPPGEGR